MTARNRARLGVLLPALAFAATIAGTGYFATSARAADHRDGPVANADPTADITDLYSWMSQDGAKVYLVMNVYPSASLNAKFSNQIRYVFHTSSNSKYGSPPGANPVDIICTFDVQQKISCWVGTKDYLTGDASQPAGLQSQSGKFKVFAGLRDDPFFFNLQGFQRVSAAVHNAINAFTFDAAGCPKVDMATSNILFQYLRQDSNNNAGHDDFQQTNVLSLVVAIDKTLLTQDGPVVSVWAGTHKPSGRHPQEFGNL